MEVAYIHHLWAKKLILIIELLPICMKLYIIVLVSEYFPIV